MQSLSFHGAAQTVTGSCHLIQFGNTKILVDCGVFQGSRQLRDQNYAPFPFDPSELDLVIVTHAHQDHIGRLPKLVKEGYQGKFLATKATIGLARIALPDAGRIQEEDAKRARKHGSRHADPQPLFSEEDAYEALKRFEPISYNSWTPLPGGAQLRYRFAGHILGSAFAEIACPDGQILLMGGDLGRYNTPIIRDPETVDHADYLVIESTYGDRFHSHEDPRARLAEVMTNAVESGGVVVVPSFSIGRTQELLYYISELQDAGQCPKIPIFLDSPMAVSATQLYANSKEEHDEDMLIAVSEGDHQLEPEGFTIVRDRDASKALNFRPGPFVVIAGSGMANAGRVVHHLTHRLGQASTQVLFTGYQAEGTLGRRLMDGADRVKVLGTEISVKATVDKLNSLSAHADQDEILKWLGGFQRAPKTTFLVHGEPDAQHGLQARIKADLGWNVEIPAMNQSFELS